jgi:predicted nucleic acid-binding protein
MPDPRKRAYWDSCVFLSYINGDPDRLPTVDALFDDAQNARFELLTSTFSVTEVAFGLAEQAGGVLDAATELKISEFWLPPSPVGLVELSLLIAEEAKLLIRFGITQGWSLKPADAVHLATARRMNVDEFHTYDDKLLKYSAQCGFPIAEPSTDTPRLFPPSAPPK